MSMYWLVDHRAPRYLPKRSDMAEVPVVLGSFVLGLFAPISVLVVVFDGGTLADWIFTVVLVLIAVHWFRNVHRYVYQIPDDPGGFSDLNVSDSVRTMQRYYRAHPDLRPVIAPVLIASYPLAVALDSGAVQERKQAVANLVADAKRSTADPEVDNADLNELNNIIKIRRQMRTEGLL